MYKKGMRHRIAIAIAVAVALSSTVAAQRVAPPTPTFGASSGGSRSVSAQSRSIPPPPPQAPSPGANVPPAPPSSPPIGIAQLPATGGGIAPLLSPSGTRDVFRAGRRTYAPRYDRSRVLDPFGYLTGGYAVGGFPGAEYQPPDGALRRDVPVESGYLRLTVQPYSAEVYVDGYYVSTVGDFSGSGPARALEAGPHRIEIRAEGYETATFDVRIEPNEMVTYRRELARADDPPRQARNIAPAIPKTFYVIPKCYAGDRRPSADKLPAGCRASNVRAIPPVVNRAR